MEHFIRIYDDMLSAAFCADVIARFDADDNRFPGRVHTSGGRSVVNLKKKRTEELVISDISGWRDVESHLQERYLECINRYAEEFPQIGEIGGQLASEAFRIKKYEAGGLFDWHIDCTGDGFYRVLAIQFYFNDVADSGATEFRFQKQAVACKRGRVAMFPTLWTYQHRGAPVDQTPKYICTNFVRINDPGVPQ